MELISTFYHFSVKELKFSPCEKYILTYNGVADQTTNNLIVWEVATAQQLRKFRSDDPKDFENFQWSYDGNYIARIQKDVLNIYELPSMSLIQDPQTKKK